MWACPRTTSGVARRSANADSSRLAIGFYHSSSFSFFFKEKSPHVVGTILFSSSVCELFSGIQCPAVEARDDLRSRSGNAPLVFARTDARQVELIDLERNMNSVEFPKGQ